MCNTQLLQIIGLAIGFIGAIFLAFSFKPIEDIGDHITDNGQKSPFCLVSYNKWRFYIGISMLAFGFLIQILSIIC